MREINNWEIFESSVCLPQNNDLDKVLFVNFDTQFLQLADLSHGTYELKYFRTFIL